MLHNFNNQPFNLNRNYRVVPNGMDTTIPFKYPSHSRKKTVVLILSLVALFGFLGGITCEVVLFHLEPTTTLIIIPESQIITATTTLTVVTGTPNASQVPGRMLSAITLTQEKKVPTTGIGHQDARAAHGWITLYNALPTKQIVPVGTSLVGADGVQVVTERNAVIPAGSLIFNGQVSIPAYTTIKGLKGNIVAHDIYGSCCRADVFAQNVKPFVGGIDARNFSMVSSQDVRNTTSTLETAVQGSVESALSTQIHDDEALITPVVCIPQVSTDHAVGVEARQVNITINDFCTGEIYMKHVLHALVIQAVKREAAQHGGVASVLSGEVTEHVEHCTVTDQQQGIIRLQVKGIGVFKAHFTQRQLQNMAALIAGKSKQEAVHQVLCLAGVKSVSIHADKQNTSPIPSSPQHIQLIIS